MYAVPTVKTFFKAWGVKNSPLGPVQNRYKYFYLFTYVVQVRISEVLVYVQPFGTMYAQASHLGSIGYTVPLVEICSTSKDV